VAVEVLLFVVLSRENPDPMYKQVFVQIRDAVGTGELQVDEKLPSIREMAKALGVSVITIKRAYLELENQGYIYSRPGLGSFVADVSLKRLRAGKLREIQRELEALTGSAAKFGISTDEIIQLMHGLKEKRNVGRSKNRRPHKTLSGVHSE
jgi:GntR family transcriptional regulator